MTTVDTRALTLNDAKVCTCNHRKVAHEYTGRECYADKCPCGRFTYAGFARLIESGEWVTLTPEQTRDAFEAAL